MVFLILYFADNQNHGENGEIVNDNAAVIALLLPSIHRHGMRSAEIFMAQNWTDVVVRITVIAQWSVGRFH